MKKLLLGLLLALSLTSASAFDKRECNIAAVNIFYAQDILNDDPAGFAAATAKIKATPAAEFEWSEELKKYIVGIADRLKPGNDPQKVGQAVYNACLKLKQV